MNKKLFKVLIIGLVIIGLAISITGCTEDDSGGTATKKPDFGKDPGDEDDTATKKPTPTLKPYEPTKRTS